MKNIFLTAIITFLVLTGTVLSFAPKKVEAAISNTVTTTNVCVVYATGGIYSGGIAVVYPSMVSYRYIDSKGSAFLWLPSKPKLKVDYLSVKPLPVGTISCVGIV